MNKRDQEIIDKLRKLPKIEDQISKDDLYKQIRTKLKRSSQTNVKKNLKSNKSKKIIPVFSTVLIVIIISIMLPSFINEMRYTNESKDFDANEVSEIEMNAEDSSPVTTDQATNDGEEQSEASMNYESYIIDTLPNDQSILHAAMVEEQLQYVIPISFIIPEDVDLSSIYNRIDDYLNEDEWGVLEYMFKEVIFDIDLENNKVIMSLPESFTLGEGTAQANMFGEMLSAMFRPYGIERVVFDDHHELDLGPYGVISEIEMLEDVLSNYKLYKHPDAERAFLTPIEQHDKTIVEALDDMKNNDDHYHMVNTIPNGVDFQVETTEDELLIQFSNDTALEADQVYITMIEAIVMTAKSYNFEWVTFKNVNIEQIGPYDLTKSLHVPLAINPLPTAEQ